MDKRGNNSHNVGKMVTLIRRVIKDPDGKIVFDSGNQPGHSFTRQWMKFWWHMTNHAYTINPIDEGTVVDTGNTARTLEGQIATDVTPTLVAAAGTETYGPQVGSGNTAVTNADYVMETPIGDGAGAGQLNYGATSSSEPVIAGANVDWVITRVWTNGSGGDVTVREVGIYFTAKDSGATQRFWLVMRDVLAIADTIANGQTYTVTFTLRTTV